MWWCISEEFADAGKERDSAQLEIAAARQSSDKIAEAVAVRRLIRAKLAEIEDIRWEAAPDFDRVIDATFEDAEALAGQHLEDSRQINNRKAEALMLLTLGEAEKERHQWYNDKVADYDPVLQKAMDAQRIFQEMGDHGMEAYTWILAAEVHRLQEDAPSSWRFGCNQTFDDLDQALLLFDDTADFSGTARAKHLMGQAYVRRNEIGEGLRLMEDARDGFIRAQNKRLEAFVLLAVADVHLEKKGGREAALPNAEEALQLYREVVPNCRRVLDAQTCVVKSQLKRGDHDMALRLATEWLETAEEKGRPRELAVAHMNLACTYNALGRKEEAVEMISQAPSIVRKLHDVRWEFEYLLETFDLYMVLEGALEAASHAAEEAMAIARDLQDKKWEALALSKMNLVTLQKLYLAQDLNPSDIQEFEHTEGLQRKLYIELGDHSMANMSRIGIVGLRGTEGMYADGKAIAEEILAEFQGLNDKGGEALAYHFLAELNSDLEHYGLAVRSALNMEACGKAIGDNTVRMKALVSQSKIHIRYEKFKEARKAAERGKCLCERTQDAHGLVDFLNLIANACMWISNEDRHPVTSRGTLVQGMKHAKHALNLANKMNNKTLKVGTLMVLARICAQRAQTEDPVHSRVSNEEAMRYVQDAIELAKQQKDQLQEAEATTVVALIHHYNGDQGRAEDAAETAFYLARKCGEVDIVQVAMDTYRQIVGGSGRPVTEERMQEAFQRRDFMVNGGAVSAAPVGPGVDLRTVREAVAELAGRATDLQSPPEFDSRLVEMGMDSLTAVSFRNGLQQKFGLKLASSILFDFPTMRDLTNHIIKEVRESTREN